MRISIAFLLLLTPFFIIAQSNTGKVAQKVIQKKATKANFDAYQIFSSEGRSVADDYSDAVRQGVTVEFDQAKVSELLKANPSELRLEIPYEADGTAFELELYEANVFAPGFSIRTSAGEDITNQVNLGKHYRGIIAGQSNSLVSISIFKNQIIGLVSNHEDNYTIGKLEDSQSKHIIYKGADLLQNNGLSCGMEDDGIEYRPEDLEFNENRDAGDCVNIYVEAGQSVYNAFGGNMTNTSNFLTGVFAQSFVVYANEGVSMQMSDMFIWTTADPYTAGNTGSQLGLFQNNTGSFNGDLGHLVEVQNIGGQAAGFSGICNSNTDNSLCFSGFSGTSYNNVPTYSFNVFLISHEMGHLMGSRHTHACVWNGNSTAIDGCSGSTEGSCSLPPSANPGTVMSYCTPNISFTQGFHPQPQAVMLNTVNNANCLSPCDGGPTCTDGIQNGQETGVDCGGPDCPDCPSNCQDNEVTITINLDNYPEETSWTLKNSAGTTVASGGTYGNEPDGSTVTATACVPDGCYDFTINDSYGDGICCSYGNGSYAVTDGNGNTLASGGSFGSTETTNFCFGASVSGCTNPAAHNYNPAATQDDGSCETCTDGIQNGDETDVDCGGALCGPCLTCVTITINLDNYPEETSWTLQDAGGTTVASGGTYGNQPDGSTVTATPCVPDGCYNFTINDSYGDGICCGYGNGSYTVVANGGTLASGGAFGSSETTNFCFGAGNLPGEGGAISSTTTTTPQAPLRIYPNPVKDVLNISTNKVIESVQFISLSGQVIRTIQGDQNFKELNTADLQAGMYYILINADGKLITEKFVKM